MGKRALIIALIFISLKVHAQVYRFHNYNSVINKAEQSFITGNYIVADSFYKIAFKINPRPQATDIQNALVNSLKADKHHSGFAYAFMLSKLGVSSSYFKKNSFIFSKLNKDRQWDQLLNEADHRRKQIDVNNFEVISTLKRYSEATENLIKEYYSDFNSYSSVSAGIRIYSDSLFNFLNKYGYLSEYTIGVNMKDDTTLAPPIFSNIISYSRYVFNKDGSIEVAYNDHFEKLLIKALNDGKISPYDFYSVYTDKDFISIRFNAAYCENNIVFLPYMEEKDIEAVNKKRQKYGLPGLREYIKLLQYYFRNKNSNLFLLHLNIRPDKPVHDNQNTIKIPL